MEVDDHSNSEQQQHHHHQMEMMSMIMDHMDNLPEFYAPYNEMSELPSPEPGSGSATDIPHNHISHVGGLGGSPPYINHPTTISFMGSPPEQEGFLSASHHQLTVSSFASQSQKKSSSMAAMREMIFRIAAMQPIHIDPETVKPPKRRNVRISKDPQSVAARHRRERISEKIRILQRLVPGGTKMDTASMLDEAIHYVKFLKSQVQSLERVAATRPPPVGFPVPMSNGGYV